MKELDDKKAKDKPATIFCDYLEDINLECLPVNTIIKAKHSSDRKHAGSVVTYKIVEGNKQ